MNDCSNCRINHVVFMEKCHLCSCVTVTYHCFLNQCNWYESNLHQRGFNKKKKHDSVTIKPDLWPTILLYKRILILSLSVQYWSKHFIQIIWRLQHQTPVFSSTLNLVDICSHLGYSHGTTCCNSFKWQKMWIYRNVYACIHACSCMYRHI